MSKDSHARPWPAAMKTNRNYIHASLTNQVEIEEICETFNVRNWNGYGTESNFAFQFVWPV